MTSIALAREALEKLQAGNERFVSDQRLDHPVHVHRAETLAGQTPFAIILGCSDSRVPSEMIFDQSLGDLFVIRVAGNVVAPSQIGSVEFAAAQFGSPLVVVLGHSSCGAVKATLAELQQDEASRSPNLRAIVDRIRPAVEPLLAEHEDDDALLHAAMRANVAWCAAQLRHGSEIIENLIAAGRLRIVGADYDLSSGRVTFFNGLDELD